MMTTVRMVTLGTLAVGACGGAEDPRPDSGSESGATSASVPLATAPTNACGWVAPSVVTEVIGAAAGEPRVVRSIERPGQPDSVGFACRYDFEAGRAVVLQVDLGGAIIEERVGGTMLQQFQQAARSMLDSAGEPVTARPSPGSGGWDHTGSPLSGYAAFTGRLGHIAISVASLTPDIDRTRTVALAERVRDAIPDLPFPLPPDPDLAALAKEMGEPVVDPPSGPDPCGLISAVEAEAVLGKLLVPPYRSAEGSALADPAGAACAYYTKGHRVLVVLPRWDSGQMLFRMADALSGVAVAAIGERGGDVADTLEGSWDASSASSVTGKLYFLKGDRMLEVDYVTSSTDMAGATRLAGTALRRL
jgi:hypothetical protein